MKYSADTHNHGQSVRRWQDQWYEKPRSIFWEYLFLSEHSFLRQGLNQILGGPSYRRLFSTWPQVNFLPDSLDFSRGKVQNIEVVNYGPVPLTPEEAWGVGATLAVCLFFGLTDLHDENVLAGRLKYDDTFVFFPVDIECVGHGVGLLQECELIPASHHKIDDSALSLIKSAIVPCRVPEVVQGYLEAIEILNAHTHEIWSLLLNGAGVAQAPIRRLFRHTRDYFNNVGDFFPCEREQMARGDIPYYFYFIHSPEVFYYLGEGMNKKISVIDLKKIPTFHPALNLSDAMAPQRAQRLLAQASMDLIDYLLPQGTQVTTLSTATLKISFSAQAFALLWRDQVWKRSQRQDKCH